MVTLRSLVLRGPGLATAVALTVAALALVAYLSSARGAEPSASPAPLPSDVVATGMAQAAGMISMDQAIAAVGKEYDLSTARVEATLVTMTDPTAGDGLIVNRPVWVVHLSGISDPISIPFGVTKLPIHRFLTNAYVYIDAYTGEWLISREQN